MIMRDRTNLLRNLFVLGAASASLLVGLPALSQTSSESTSATPDDFQLSAEGFKILCERSPLNSRCQGGEQPTAVPSTSEPRESVNPSSSQEPTAPSFSPEPSAPSDTTAPSVEPSAPEPSGSTSPSDKPGSMEAPGAAPSSPTDPSMPKPQSLTVPSPGSPSMAAPSLAPSETPSTSPSSAPSLSPVPSMSPAPGMSPAPSNKGRTDTPSAQTPAAPTAPSVTPRTPGGSTSPTTPSVTPRTPGSTAPTAPGAAPAPAQSPSAAPATPVSETELQKFAKVIPQLQEIQQSAQQQVSEAIKKAGLSEDRFRELYGAQQSPSAAQASTPATPQERQAVQQVVSQLETIKTETQTRREQAVTSQGLELNRFNEILTAVRQDSELQQQLQQMLNN